MQRVKHPGWFAKVTTDITHGVAGFFSNPFVSLTLVFGSTLVFFRKYVFWLCAIIGAIIIYWYRERVAAYLHLIEWVHPSQSKPPDNPTAKP